MKILLIEDEQAKRLEIELCIHENESLKRTNPNITHAGSLIEAIGKIHAEIYDLIIFDMFLPDSDKTPREMIRDCSEELITEFSRSKNYKSETIALTQFDIDDVDNIRSFNISGITVVKFDTTNRWKQSLSDKIDRISQNVKYDFLIFCALPIERNAFLKTNVKIGDKRNISGLDCQEATIGLFSGLIIKPLRMGLVNMAIIATKAIELFQPKIVTMSGICAGINGRSNFLDLIVGSECWEYQTGKWKDGEFKCEPYQVPLSSEFRVDLSQSTEDPKIREYLVGGLFHNELNNFKILMAPITSGSAVIADEQLISDISNQQRKMAGLEMEMYSLYEAATQSLCKPLYFGAKSVVDLGNSAKGDDYHNAASIISARYIEVILSQKLPTMT